LRHWIKGQKGDQHGRLLESLHREGRGRGSSEKSGERSSRESGAEEEREGREGTRREPADSEEARELGKRMDIAAAHWLAGADGFR
jgi:hypothetical protein